jgi:hypothetical protein
MTDRLRGLISEAEAAKITQDQIINGLIASGYTGYANAILRNGLTPKQIITYPNGRLLAFSRIGRKALQAFNEVVEDIIKS